MRCIPEIVIRRVRTISNAANVFGWAEIGLIHLCCLAHQRLTIGIQEEIAIRRIGLIDNIVQFLISQDRLVAIRCCPAAGAVEIAG